jgi:hypothetical protein
MDRWHKMFRSSNRWCMVTRRQQQENSSELPVLLPTTFTLSTFGNLWEVSERWLAIYVFCDIFFQVQVLCVLCLLWSTWGKQHTCSGGYKDTWSWAGVVQAVVWKQHQYHAFRGYRSKSQGQLRSCLYEHTSSVLFLKTTPSSYISISGHKGELEPEVQCVLCSVPLTAEPDCTLQCIHCQSAETCTSQPSTSPQCRLGPWPQKYLCRDSWQDSYLRKTHPFLLQPGKHLKSVAYRGGVAVFKPPPHRNSEVLQNRTGLQIERKMFNVPIATS